MFADRSNDEATPIVRIPKTLGSGVLTMFLLQQGLIKERVAYRVHQNDSKGSQQRQYTSFVSYIKRSSLPIESITHISIKMHDINRKQDNIH